MSVSAQLWAVRLVAWAILATIWFCLGDYCCQFSGVGDGGLISAGGVSSFAEISFALNTSIALRWFKVQFLSVFDRFAKNRLIEYAVAKDGEISENSIEQLYADIEMLKEHFIHDMSMPAHLYGIVGIAVSVFIATVLWLGMPICLKPYIILLPFPALAYYITGLLTGGLMIVRFEECLHLR